ncbi:hypothetical protein [Arthrobacter sp. A2-55]|uniref:hypothetical protein n=1 Tax=Arthrobacter sp. A2-55 TaxID=2897337 RepID=UPI0021CD98FA|nr:hypothetical protein [Arthrobacter sp. A2-55]MCU6480142.1 hypothetical protein [Arthrobacter sp. A2-55]
MTTDTLATPIEAFRSSRDALLTTLLTSLNGLEVSVLSYDQERERHLEQLEAELAAALTQNVEPSMSLGERGEETVQVPIVAPELVEARASIEHLEAELAALRKAAAGKTPVYGATDIPELESDEILVPVDMGKVDSDAFERAQARVAELESEALEAVERIESLEAELVDMHDKLTATTTRADESDARTTALEAELGTKKAQFAQERLAAVDTATRAALKVLAAVAADEPDAPLSEAVELVEIALGVEATRESAPEVTDATSELPVLPDLADFDAFNSEEPVAPAAGSDGKEENSDPQPLASVSTLELIAFEELTDDQAHSSGEPGKGFGFFGRKKGDKAA